MIHKTKVTNPLVSVIMPVYNADKYIRASIDSILTQIYSQFELIIVDDKSTDDSWSIISEYARKYPKRIQAIQAPRNLNREGDACYNLGAQVAKGVYLARMDADDIADKNRLFWQVEYLETHPDIFLVGGQAEIIDGKGNMTGRKKVPVGHKKILHDFFNIHPLIHPTIMMRNENPGKPFYMETYHDCNDYYTFYSLLLQGKKFANLPQPVLKYRVHGMNCTLRRLKRKLWTTLSIRWAMILKYGLRPSAKQWVQFIVQLGAAVLLPEWLFRKIYMMRTRQGGDIDGVVSYKLKKVYA